MNDNFEYWLKLSKGINNLRQDPQSNNQQIDTPTREVLSTQFEQSQKLAKDKQDLESVIEDLREQIQQLQQKHNEELVVEKANLDKHLLDLTKNFETDNQKLDSQMRDLNTQKQRLEDELTQVKQQLQQFTTQEQSRQQQITTLQQQYNKELEKEKAEKETINNRLIAIEDLNNKLKDDNNNLNKQLQKYITPELSISATQTLPQDTFNIIEEFNRNPSSLEQYAEILAEVIVDSESFTQYRDDNSKQIILRQLNSQASGIGLIISPRNGESSGYFLIPKESTVSASNYTQIRYLFKCNKYREGLKKFMLKKLAKVSPLNNQ